MANGPPNFEEGFERGNSSPLSGISNAYAFGTLNTLQLEWLMRHISTEDMAQLSQMTGQCARKCAVTYGGPIASLTFGLLEFMRRKQNLPIKSPRYLIGYPIMIFSSALLGSSVGLKRSNCGAQTRLFLERLYAKYESQVDAGSTQIVPRGGAGISPTINYAQLREANRADRPIETEKLKPQQQRRQHLNKGQQLKTGGAKPTTDETATGGMASSDDWGLYGLEGVFVPSPPTSSSDGIPSASSSPSPPPPKAF